MPCSCGGEVSIFESDPIDRAYDVPYYVTDARAVADQFGWAAKRQKAEVLADIFSWLREQEDVLRPLLAG